MAFEINLHRKWFTPRSTVGELYYSDHAHEMKKRACFTLEDTLRAPGVKIQGETCIPAGRYRVVVSYSHKFGQMMPEVLDVPMFSGVRIHVGNKPEDSDGCILLGRTDAPNFVGESKPAYADFCRRFCQALNDGEQVFINIHGSPSADKRTGA